MKGHAPLGTESTPTLAAVGRGESKPAPVADAASSVEAVGAGAAMNQSAAMSMQTVGAGNSFAVGLASGGDGGPAEPGGVQAVGGYAAAGPEAMAPEEQEAFQERAAATFGTSGEGAVSSASPPASESAVAGTPGPDATAGGGGPAPAADALQIDVSNKHPVGDQWHRTVIGVGEEVTFWGSQDGGTWSSSAGTGAPGPDGEYEWTAPADMAVVTITYTLDGTNATVRMIVLPPMYITGTLIGPNNTNQTPGLAGAGMDVQLTMGPTNVSFYNVEWLEDPGGPSQKSGYFGNIPDSVLYHNPNPNWLLMGEDNKAITDTAAYFGAPSPFSDGSFTWIVPNRFRVAGQGTGRVFWPSIQHMTMAADGTATVSKFGQSTSRSP